MGGKLFAMDPNLTDGVVEPEARLPARSTITEAWSLMENDLLSMGSSDQHDDAAKQSNPGFGTLSRLDSINRAAWGVSIRRVKPLLTSDLSVDVDSSSVNSKESAKRVRNPYQRSFVILFSAFSVTALMAALQEVVLLVGISGCSRGNMSEEGCDGIRLMFVSAPLMFRQVGRVSICQSCEYFFFRRSSIRSFCFYYVSELMPNNARMYLAGLSGL